MPLHSFKGIKIGVPNPADLADFYAEIGLQGEGEHWGTRDLPQQIEICESPYRQLREIRLACTDDADLHVTAGRLDALGIACELRSGALLAHDPLNHLDIAIEPGPPLELQQQPTRRGNRPGDRTRPNARAEVVIEASPRPPRRLGHAVIGTPHIEPTRKLFVEGLGFRLSDAISGFAFFLRCSPDHHNFLIQPGQVPYLNHYAFEHDDVDAVARAATLYLERHLERQIAGPGRHVIGSNVFWYMKDPCGNYFEFFTDMDCIERDDSWQAQSDWPLDGNWSVWGAPEPPEVFFQPDDIEEISAGQREEYGS